MKPKRIYIVTYIAMYDKRSLVAALRPYKLAGFISEKNIPVTIISPQKGNGSEVVVSEGLFISMLKPILKIFPPDHTLFWSIRIFFRLRKEWKREPFYLFTTCPPYGLGFLGLLLKWLGYRFKWICDFRDLWIGNPLYQPPVTKRYFNPVFERLFYKKCDVMTFNTEWDLRYNCKRFPFLRDKSIYVRNGFDAISANKSKDEFRFIYAGGTTKGAATPRIVSILETLNAHGVPATCDFYGEYDQGLEGNPYIKYHGVVAPESVAEILVNYKFGFIYLPPGCETGGRVAQKFYDYVGAGVIPVCVRPSQEMVGLMQKLKTGVMIFDDTLPESIVSEIKNAKFSAGEDELKPLTRNFQFEHLYRQFSKLNL